MFSEFTKTLEIQPWKKEGKIKSASSCGNDPTKEVIEHTGLSNFGHNSRQLGRGTYFLRVHK